MTIVDSVADEHYGADRQDAGDALRARCSTPRRAIWWRPAPTSIQFDEPCFNIYLDEVEAWGIEALEQCMDGVSARKAVHICYGYGTPAVLAWKTKNTDWGHYGVTLPLLAKSSVDQVSVECAASGVDVSVLRELGGKDVLLGVDRRRHRGGRDAGGRGRSHSARARSTCRPRGCFPCTDCGLVPRSREAVSG